jgi:N-formylglutamate amidohydrolase
VIKIFQLKNRRDLLPIRRIALQTFCLIAALAFYQIVFAQDSSSADRLLTVWAGSLPIILSAPHGGRQAIPGIPSRRGIGVAQFTVERDGNTAELAEAVGGKLSSRLGGKPFLVVAEFERKYVDANRSAAMAYESIEAKPYYDAYHERLRQAVEQVGQKWGGGLLLDLHGQGANGEAIFRGTGNGKSVALLEKKFGWQALSGPKSILGQLAAKGYRILPDPSGSDHEQRYSGGFTTQTYGSHRGTQVDVIQLEFGTSFRVQANLERTAGDLAAAIEVFAQNFLPLKGIGNGISPGARP